MRNGNEEIRNEDEEMSLRHGNITILFAATLLASRSIMYEPRN